MYKNWKSSHSSKKCSIKIKEENKEGKDCKDQDDKVKLDVREHIK
jgi:hypothetical protein